MILSNISIFIAQKISYMLPCAFYILKIEPSNKFYDLIYESNWIDVNFSAAIVYLFVFLLSYIEKLFRLLIPPRHISFHYVSNQTYFLPCYFATLYTDVWNSIIIIIIDIMWINTKVKSRNFLDLTKSSLVFDKCLCICA